MLYGYELSLNGEKGGGGICTEYIDYDYTLHKNCHWLVSQVWLVWSSAMEWFVFDNCKTWGNSAHYRVFDWKE